MLVHQENGERNLYEIAYSNFIVGTRLYCNCQSSGSHRDRNTSSKVITKVKHSWALTVTSLEYTYNGW